MKTAKEILAEHEGHAVAAMVSDRHTVECDDCDMVLAAKEDSPALYQELMAALE